MPQPNGRGVYAFLLAGGNALLRLRLIAGLRMGYNVAGFDIKETQVKASRDRIKAFAIREVQSHQHLRVHHLHLRKPVNRAVDRFPKSLM